jgi:hypothetical protein
VLCTGTQAEGGGFAGDTRATDSKATLFEVVEQMN